jgi:hypothetical protein
MIFAGWGCGGVGVLPLLAGFSCKVFSSISPRFYFMKHAFCFLPLVTILESLYVFFKRQLGEAEGKGKLQTVCNRYY